MSDDWAPGVGGCRGHGVAGSVGLAASFGQADITHDVIGIAEALSGLSVAHEVMSVSAQEQPFLCSLVP